MKAYLELPGTNNFSSFQSCIFHARSIFHWWEKGRWFISDCLRRSTAEDIEGDPGDTCTIGIESKMNLGRNDHVLRRQKISMEVHVAFLTVRLEHAHSGSEVVVA